MALQSSGRIKISDLVTEFGGGTPRKLTNYYRGGSLVVQSTNNATVPTSGRIKLSNFYNTGGFSISIISGSQRQIGGTDSLFYNNETFSTNSGIGPQSKLVVVYCTRATSHTLGGDSETNRGPCTISGVSVTEVLNEETHFDIPTFSQIAGRVTPNRDKSCASVQYICNIGNRSSFNITLGRSNSSGGFTGIGPALAMIIQVDGVSFTSPFRSVETLDSYKNFSKTLNPTANKGFTIFSTAVHPEFSGNVGTPKANGSAMDTTFINNNTAANRCAIAVQNETTGGSVTYTLDGSGTGNNGLTATTIGNYAF